jgi:predicted metal-dependent peptidase
MTTINVEKVKKKTINFTPMTPSEFEQYLYNKQWNSTVFSHKLLLSLLNAIPIEYNNEYPSIGVDGSNLIVNLDWFSSIEDSSKLFILLHEGYHLFFAHPQRGKNKIHRIYNIATDLYINTLLEYELGLSKVPEGGIDLNYVLSMDIKPFTKSYEEALSNFNSKNLLGLEFNAYTDWMKNLTTDKIYDLIRSCDSSELNKLFDKGFDFHIQGDMSKDIEKKFNDLPNYYKPSLENNEELLSIKMDNIVVEDELENYFSNTLDKEQKNWYEKLYPKAVYERVDWKDLLKSNLRDTLVKLETYMYPSRRNIAIQKVSGTRCVLPSNRIQQNKNSSKIHIWCDKSGSVSIDKLRKVMSEIKDLCEDLPNNELYFYFFDRRAEVDTRFYKTKNHPLPDVESLRLTSGGGTDFSAFYRCYFCTANTTKDLVDNKYKKLILDQPDICVVITDGQSSTIFKNSDKLIGKEMYWIIDSDWWNYSSSHFKPNNSDAKVIYRKL